MLAKNLPLHSKKNLSELISILFKPIILLLIGVILLQNNVLGNPRKDIEYIQRLFRSAEKNKSNLILALKQLDSARILANKTDDKGLQALVFIKKGQILRYNHYLIRADSSLVNAWNLSQSQNPNKEYINLLHDLVEINYELGHYKDILSFSMEGVEVTRHNDDDLFYGFFNNYAGIALEKLNSPKKALKYFLGALKTFHSLNDRFNIINVENNIGNVYLKLSDLEKAEKYYLNAYIEAEQIKDSNVLSLASCNLGIVYSHENEYYKAKSFMLKGFKYSNLQGDPLNRANSMINLGKLYADMHMHDSSLYYYKETLKLTSKICDDRILYSVLNKLANFYSNIEDNSKSIEYALRALDVARRSGTIKNQLDVLKLLNELYAKNGDYKKVYDLTKKYNVLHDSLYSKQLESQLTIIEANDQVREKSKQLFLQKVKNERKQEYFIFSIIGLLFLALVFAFLYERKRAQSSEDKRQKAYLDAILEESESYVILLDSTGHYIYLSPSYFKTFGHINEYRIGENAFDKFHPDDKEKLKEIQNGFISGALERKFLLFRIKNKKEEYRTLRGFIKSIKNNPFLKGYIMNFWDVTEIQKSQDALKQSEEKFRNIFDAFNDIYVMTDEQRRVIEVSPSVTKITGYLPKEVLGQELANFTRTPELLDKINDMLSKNEKVSDFSIDLIGKDGKKIHCSLNAYYIYDKEGNRQGVVGTFRDISVRVHAELDLKKSEKELKALNNTKDKLLSLMSHDVRGAIGTEKAILSLITSEAEDFTKEEMLSMVLTIKRSVDNTYNLVENLLSWSKTMQNNIEAQMDENEVYPLVMKSFDLMKERAEAKKIDLYYDGDQKITGYFDENLMDAVIRNLLNNSIKFSKPGSEIKVIVNENDGKLFIRVKDQGIGFTKDEIKKIITEKENIQSKPGTKNEKGTGLGLIIVREFVTLNKGTINIISEPGKGSEFVIELLKNPKA